MKSIMPFHSNGKTYGFDDMASSGRREDKYFRYRITGIREGKSAIGPSIEANVWLKGGDMLHRCHADRTRIADAPRIHVLKPEAGI